MKYKLILSTRQEVLMDEADFLKVKSEIGSGNLIKIKRGIINPSFAVAILPVEDSPKRIMNGYVDEKTRKFVLTEDREEPESLDDSFSEAERLTK